MPNEPRLLAVRPRDERPADRIAVRNLHLTAFAGEGRVVAELVDDLRQLVTDHTGVSLVADDAGDVVGDVMFTPGLLDPPGGARRCSGDQSARGAPVAPW